MGRVFSGISLIPVYRYYVKIMTDSPVCRYKNSQKYGYPGGNLDFFSADGNPTQWDFRELCRPLYMSFYRDRVINGLYTFISLIKVQTNNDYRYKGVFQYTGILDLIP